MIFLKKRGEFKVKKFISISPFQNPERMKEGIVYKPDNNPELEYTATSFPIIPVINAYAESGEKIEIITVVSEYDFAKGNYEITKEEVEKLSEKNNFDYELKEIRVPFSDDLDTQLDMFGKLIDLTADNDTLYADITFGSKVMTQVLNMALNYGYRVHKDVALGCIVYGKLDHSSNCGIIYDQTSLNYMDEIVRVMAENKVANPAEKIKKLLK